MSVVESGPRIIYHIVPTYQRTSLYTTEDLSELQVHILLLLGERHTLSFILTMLACLHNEKHLYSAIWREMKHLKRLGLLKTFAPDIQQASSPVQKKASNYPQPYGKYAPHGQYLKVA